MVDRTDGLLYQTGQGYSQLDAQSARDRLDGYAVVSGLDVTPGGSLSVDVAPGEAIVGTDTNGDTITVSPGSTQNVSLAAADSANPRKDTVWIDDTGTAQVTTGTAESALPEGNSRFNTFQPEPPFPGGDGTILAEVYVAAGASSLTSADIRDRRQPAQIVGEEIQTTSAEHESVNTELSYTGSVADVSAYGAPTTGNGDATNIIQQAIDDVKPYGMVYLPEQYDVLSTLDVTNTFGVIFYSPGTTKGFADTFRGDVPGLIGKTNGDPVIDATGSYGCVFSMALYGDATDTPNIGVLEGRSNSQPTPYGNRYINAQIVRNFTLANVYNVGNEVADVENCDFTTTQDGGSCIYHTGDNSEGITSAFATINPVDSLTGWSYNSTAFLTDGAANADAVRYRSTAFGDTKFDSCFFSTNDPTAKAVVIDSGIGNPTGPLKIESCGHENDSSEPLVFAEGTGNLINLQIEDNRTEGPICDLTNLNSVSRLTVSSDAANSAVNLPDVNRSRFELMDRQTLSAPGATNCYILSGNGVNVNITTPTNTYHIDLDGSTAGFI